MNQKGFTLVELLTVSFLVLTLTLIALTFAGSTLTRNSLRNTTTEIVDTLRRAQWQTMNGFQDTVYGVHFESGQFVLYQGAVYSAGAATNVVTSVQTPVSISAISLNGGGSDVLFSDPHGETAQYGSVTITDATTETSQTVTINAFGMVDAD